MRALLRRAGGELDHCQEYALVFIRQERAWQTNEQISHTDDDNEIEQQVTPGAAQNIAYAIGVVMRALIKQAVKPAEKAFFPFAMIAFGDGFEHRRAQRRRQDQRDQHRQRHRRYDGDRELTINCPG
ncbi:Uncharacterised protein [Salmonella enterica subsp. enterica serovar Bovismorbificans]|uniref:Uncharacterized protein n=1 Tax=Salmonella enterica subsp. enterica serovar Bovismorbificans TaxID=58097 RepID=A0A655DNS8_SALET|nr:Uncharacterised protein [Salmonella enterica subsp. enterica serovar Bovismorbificans]CNU78196.1 Uncharacterised protein [Salmonella enterica subsp. enterica serovar Bovismorbificans]CNV12922.1 Uncharacterised protein [Salmonella enterica subsp. enterica serovar Bovismorbificans]CPR49229.1 Uncharacterised protein [Salmonella enterica subsp. enterica serovar Bovismorbificans]